VERTTMTATHSKPRWIPAALLAVALGAGAAFAPAPAKAADVQVRVLVDVAELIFRSGRPYYYERGHYHPVVVEYDHWHRPVYYRYVPRPVVVHHHHHAPPPRKVVVHHHAPPPPLHHDHRASWRGPDRHPGKRHGRGHGR